MKSNGRFLLKGSSNPMIVWMNISDFKDGGIVLNPRVSTAVDIKKESYGHFKPFGNNKSPFVYPKLTLICCKRRAEKP